MKHAIPLLALAALPVLGLDDSALTGAYHYRYLRVAQTEAGGAVEVTQSLGTMVFDGRGTYTEGANRRGYMVDERGYVTLPAPGSFQAMDGRISPDTGVLLGSSTETSGWHDLLVAVRTSVAPTAPRGTYHAAVLLLPSSRADAAVSTQASFDLGEAQLQMSGDGTGSMTLPLATNLPTRSYNVAASGDGRLLIGSPRSGRGLLVAVAATEAEPSGVYWTMAMALEDGRVSSSVGSLRVEGTRRIRMSQRWNQAGRASDYVGVRPIGAPGVGAGTMVTATTASQAPSLTFAARIPTIRGSGVFVDPHGVTNGASEGPVGATIAPGALMTITGRGLASASGAAGSVPLPIVLQGTRVDINGAPAALHSVEEGMVRLVAPAEVRTGDARVVVRNAAGSSVAVRTRIAAASPSIFADAVSGTAIATHADYRPISIAAPARVGQVVVLFATGLGINRPAVNVWIGGRTAEVLYSGTSGMPGLDQLNVRIPAGAAAGDAIPVTLTDGESYSDTTTIAISQ